MDNYSNVSLRSFILFSGIILVMTLMSGCEGDQGATGAAGNDGISPVNSVTLDEVTSRTTEAPIDMTIDGVSIDSPPVVDFSIRDADGMPVVGLVNSDIRFTFAKLVPSNNGDPSYWQSYINQEETATVGSGTGNTSIQATYERDGTLVDNNDGSYRYTFATDVANVTTPLAVDYDASLTHRVAIQVGGGLPATNPVYTFRPSDGATTGIFTRDIVTVASCNECHNQLGLHGGGRIETEYCVTCHNPGSVDANSGNSVDFKQMIHKIHRGEDLPSVDNGGEYVIYGFRNSKHDYSDVVLPQDIRNCTKCHDGANPATPDGDNWKTHLSIQACGSCHDDVDFSKDGSDAGADDPDGHEGGIVSNNSECITCHASGRIAGSVEDSHFMEEPAARAKFKLNILEICGTAVDNNPQCAPGDNPSVKFSITDPTNSDAEYDLDTTAEIANSSVSFLVAWDTRDYNNSDGTGARPGRADSIDFDEAGYVDDGFKRTVTASFIIPDGSGATGYSAIGSGAIGAQGRLAGDFNNDTVRERSERIFVKSEVEFFRIDDAEVVERRPTVENAKCNKCHDQVSFHGGSRSGEYGVCILCHNPNNTDIAQRTGGPVPPDGKTEETIDFKYMIHGIHAALRDDPLTDDGDRSTDDDVEGHGFREKGLVVYGYNNSVHDYSHVRFPGILNDCQTCHEEGAYLLDGIWASPTANGILSTTVTSNVDFDHDDDLNVTPTAAVCSACHDSDVAKAHMMVPGGAVFDQTQNTISSTIVETCSVCHGPGRDADVEAAHAAR